MRGFLAIVIKDLRIRFSSPMALVFFILLPVVFTVALSGASMARSGGAKAAPLVLLHDGAGTPEARAFAAMLGTMSGVRVREVSDPTALIATSEPDLLLSIAPGPAAETGLPFALTFKLSPWRSSAGETARRVGEWLVGARAAYAASTASPSAAADSTKATSSAPSTTAPAAGTTAPVSPRTAAPVPTATVSAPPASAVGNAGQIITWALVPLLGLGAGLIGERRRGTTRRILSTPAARGVVLSAGAAAEVAGALVQILLLVTFGSLVFGLPWFAHPLELVGLSFAFCVAGAALGAFLGAVCRTSRQAGSLGLAIAMVLAVFGGCWYPAAFFPSGLRAVARLDPAGWAMDGFLAVLSPSAAAGAALRSTILLLIFGALVFLLSAAATRLRGSSAA